MNFGEKFPYALLTFSQKFVEAGYWVRLLPKVCRSWLWATPYPKSLSKLVIGHTCSTHAHLLPKVCRSWLLGTLYLNHYPHAQLHINSHAPHPIHPHQLYTHHTLAIHPPHTPPPASWQRRNEAKPQGLWLMRRWNARSGPVWGQKSTKWTPRLRGRKRRWMRCTARMGRLRILPSLRRQSSRKPYNISENHTNSKKIT